MPPLCLIKKYFYIVYNMKFYCKNLLLTLLVTLPFYSTLIIADDKRSPQSLNLQVVNNACVACMLMECTERSLITRISTFYPRNPITRFDHLSRETYAKHSLCWSKSVSPYIVVARTP